MRVSACALAIVLIAPTAAADEFATSPARPGYEGSDHLLGWPGRTRLEKRGVIVDGTYALDLFAAPQLDNRFVAGGLFTAELDLDLAALVSDRLGAMHASAFAIHGTGITEELMDIYGTSGNTAPEDVRLFEAWIDQPLGPFTLRAGLVAVDQEFNLADHSTTLLNATFGITSQFSYNVLGPVYPVATPGASGRLELDGVTVRAAIYDGTQTNLHGVPTELGPDHLVIGEVTLADRFKLGGWHHSEHGEAIYAVVDAELDPMLGAFARAGYHPDADVDTYIDAGIRATPGSLRPDDFISWGLAFARSETGAQIAMEMTYEFQIRWLTIQPDVQLILLHERTVAIAATRLTVAL